MQMAKFSYGMNDKNPIELHFFYNKHDEKFAYLLSSDEVRSCLKCYSDFNQFDINACMLSSLSPLYYIHLISIFFLLHYQITLLFTSKGVRNAS